MGLVKAIHIFFIILLATSCGGKKNKTSEVTIETINLSDSVFFNDMGTDAEIAVLSGTSIVKFSLEFPALAEIKTKSSKSSYLTILKPNSIARLKVLQDSTLTTNSLADSLINYLSANTLDFINKNLDFIFTTPKRDSIVQLFENYKYKRESMISTYDMQLSIEEIELLNYYNMARLYGFLLFYGIVPKKIEAENNFYDFVNRIGSPTQTLKIFPHLYLYKYKIEYQRENKHIEKASDFLNYIEEKLNKKDLSDYLKISFLKELIATSPYWEGSREILDVEELNQILDDEKHNNYYNLLESYSRKFLLTQKGRPAFNFKAERTDGTYMKLADQKGKVVFIDVWATWCGPCLKERPRVLGIAKKYENNQDFKMLMISVDTSKKKWLDFLSKHNENINSHVLISDGMNTLFGYKYNITSIPRYILIDKKGSIVDAHLEHPSEAVERLISTELSKL